MTYYLIRFDDINPNMNWEKFNKLKSIITKYKIKSILGVVPNCEDTSIAQFETYKDYFNKLQEMKLYGDTIAQHGYKHITDKKCNGLYGSNGRSEFASHSYEIQYQRIKEGKKILVKNKIWEPLFMAPSHSFDKTTIKVLKKLGFKTITDGFSRYTYDLYGIKMIPQLSAMPLPRNLPILSQLCIHINTLNQAKLEYLIKFIIRNNKYFISFQEALELERNSFLSKAENLILSLIIHLKRYIYN